MVAAARAAAPGAAATGHVARQGSFLFPVANGGEPAVLYCFLFLFFAATGPGAWSLDAVLRKTRS